MIPELINSMPEIKSELENAVFNLESLAVRDGPDYERVLKYKIGYHKLLAKAYKLIGGEEHPEFERYSERVKTAMKKVKEKLNL